MSHHLLFITSSLSQGGYNVDLLSNETRAVRSSPELNPALNHSSRHGHAESALASKEVLDSYPTRQRTPWYRTTKWIIILVICAVVAIAAIVAGAVAGSVHKHHNVNSAAVSASVGSSTSSSAAPTGSDGGVVGGGAPLGTSTSSSPSGGDVPVAPASTSSSTTSQGGAIPPVNMVVPTAAPDLTGESR